MPDDGVLEPLVDQLLVILTRPAASMSATAFQHRLTARAREFLRAQTGTARMTAGYCGPGVIHDLTRPLSTTSSSATGRGRGTSKGPRRRRLPAEMLWASEPNGFGQVGWVYTAQGFEYDWNGVILGPDLTIQEGRLVTVRQENKDPAFKSRRAVPDADFNLLVRHVYKVLLTRGMRGNVIYAMNPELRNGLLHPALT